MKAEVLTKDVVSAIQGYLGDCSQKVVCRYLGVTTVAMSQNILTSFSDILDNKVGRRLDVLLYVLESAKNDATLESSALHRLLTLPSLTDESGWEIDVVSAIHNDASKEMALKIFNESIRMTRKPVDNGPVVTGLYNLVHQRTAIRGKRRLVIDNDNSNKPTKEKVREPLKVRG